MEATTKDLRLHTRELLAATDRGEEVVISYRGQARARLLPWDKNVCRTSRVEGRNPLFGLWRGRDQQTVDEQVRSLRKGRYAP
jgi:antitoxin (DNA-binding transcriptional repressor) of toxin-antitoxin stability system